MKNKLTDLNNHLFATLERLNDIEIKGSDLVEEISRAKQISEISKQITDVVKVDTESKRLKFEVLKHIGGGEMTPENNNLATNLIS